MTCHVLFAQTTHLRRIPSFIDILSGFYSHSDGGRNLGIRLQLRRIFASTTACTTAQAVNADVFDLVIV